MVYFQYLVWNLVILIDEKHSLLAANPKILVCEGVRSVPSNGSELPSVLDDSMEEAETENQLFDGINFLT